MSGLEKPGGPFTCVEAPGVPPNTLSWPLTRDDKQSDTTRHVFTLDRNSAAYKSASFVPPVGIDYIGKVFTGSNDDTTVTDYYLNLFNTQTADDAVKAYFIYSLTWGPEHDPTYVKHWYLSNFDVCRLHVEARTNAPIEGIPTMKLTRY